MSDQYDWEQMDRAIMREIERDCDGISTQQAPEPGGTRVLDSVLADLILRADMGKSRYGDFLRTNNGRNPLLDAYQEALDLVMYLKQALLEMDLGDEC